MASEWRDLGGLAASRSMMMTFKSQKLLGSGGAVCAWVWSRISSIGPAKSPATLSFASIVLAHLSSRPAVLSEGRRLNAKQLLLLVGFLSKAAPQQQTCDKQASEKSLM